VRGAGGRHHKSDGLIFAPNLPYHCGTDYNYFKWKWHDTITLDFEAQRVQVSPRTPHGVAVSFASQDGRVDFTEHIVLSAIDRCRLLGDIGPSPRTIITEWSSPNPGVIPALPASRPSPRPLAPVHRPRTQARALAGP
jgi:hypothetical protein